MKIRELGLSIKILVGLITLLIVALLFYSLIPQSYKEEKNIEGEEIILPQPKKSSQTSIEEALLKRRSVREYQKETLNLEEVSQLLWAAQGITDPKTDKRTAPSAGALYPLKAYVMGQIKGLSIGIYQYNPHRHSLIKFGDKDLKKEIAEAAYGQKWIEEAPVNFILTGNYGIIAQKYGQEKAPRYTQMEVGHVAQNIYLQAVSLNLGTVSVGGFDIEKVKEILRLPPEEEPLYIMPVGKLSE